MNLAKHVKIREEKFGTVIFDTLREKVFVVNKQGADILRLVLDGKSKKQTVEALKQNYHASGEAITKDVTSFIDHLEKNKLLVE